MKPFCGAQINTDGAPGDITNWRNSENSFVAGLFVDRLNGSS